MKFAVRRAVGAVLGGTVAAAGLQVMTLPAAHASAAPYSNLMISEVYGGDGSANATYHHDFVELFNPTPQAITFADNSLYVSYFAATSSTSNPVAIPSATIPAYTHFMIERSAAGTGATPVNQDVPHADATIALPDIAGAGGRVYLQDTATAQTATGDVTGNAHIIDAISGNGANTASYEGSSMGTVGGGATTSLQRKDDPTHGYLDTNTTATDLKAAAPTPKSTLDGPLSLGGGGSTSSPLALATVADKTAYRNTPIAPIALSASGGTAPYTYSLSGDVDGSGLKVSTTGVISGLPSAAGTYHLTAKVTDSAATPDTEKQDFTLTVSDGDTANHVVIAEVWGDGGYNGSAYKNSFIELYNPTDSSVDLSGDSIAYLGSNNSTNTGTPGATRQGNLSGTVPAHSYYLIAGSSSSGGTSGVDLPAPDDYFTDGTNTNIWHYADGTVALLDTQDPFTMPTGDLTGAAHVVDALGYGVSTSYAPFAYEGAVSGKVTGGTTAALRSPVGTDTNNNGTDFTTIAPYAINSNGDTQPELRLAAITDRTALTNQAMTPVDLDVSGGVGAITYSLTGAPAGISVDPHTGVISGTPTAAGTSTITAKATDALNDVASVTFKLTVGSFLVANPGDQTLDKGGAADIQIAASPANTNGYGFALKSGSTLPAGLSLNPATGEITGTPTATQQATPVTVTVTNNDDSSTIDVTFTITITADITSIATIQGAGQRSAYAPSSGIGAGQTVTTEGVVTAVWDKGYSGTGTAATLGTANSGLSGFVIQTPDPDVATSTSSEAIFVYYTGTAFAGKDANGAGIAVGDSVKVSGTVSEYKAASAASTETATEITASVANTHKLGTSLGSVAVQTSLPATYADREAHEWEAYAPTDTVVTDTYDYESDGELGLASGGKPLVQPTEICTTAQASCIQDAETDIVNHGYFLGDGTNTFFLASGTHYNPSKSGNSAIPLPYMDASHSARVGAKVTAPAGHALILGFWPDLSQTAASRPGKWYLQPQRAVLGTPGTTATEGTPDLGTDVVNFQNTRADNAAPDPANINAGPSKNPDAGSSTSNIRVATFNVENYFTETGEAFADDNPAIGNSAAGVTSSTTKGCQYDYDRAGNRELTFQCVSPYGQASAWDPVSGTPTAYKAGVTNAPRGAARQEDLDRQTAKIVTAINGLGGIDPHAVNYHAGADIVSLEEIENPNKLKQGITNSPLSPDLSNLKDQGQGTPIANRDVALKYLVDKLNAAAGSNVWAYVKSPEEATDATSMVHMCSILRGDGVSNIDGNAASLANSACSYASGQDVIRPAFIYKVATIVPVGPSDIDFPANPLSPDNAGNNAQPTYNGATPFDLAREPLAQFFKPKGYPNSDGFAVIVNHFKSKGGTSTADDPGITVTGDNKSDPLVGAYNTARTKEAQELVRFANQFAAQWNTDKVLMVGDFNSYTDEDPIKAVLDSSKTDPDNGIGALDFSLIESSDPSDLTYNYTSDVNVGLDSSGALHVATPNTSGTSGTDEVGYGTVGSIDHEFMSEGFKSMFTGADVWEINANETDAYDYGRFNTNATDFYYGTAPDSSIPANPTYAQDLSVATPFRSSDHNPMVMGIDVPALDAANPAKVTDVQLVGVNDFHGRLIADSSDGGAAALGGAVDELRDQYGADKTLFVSGGDNVGASTFESFTAHDKPSLDALTSLGLDVSTVGNHEFDGQSSLGANNVGWKDLVNRLMKPYDASTNPFGPAATAGDPSGIPYLAANVTYATDPDGSGPLKAGDTIAPATRSFTIANPLDASKPIKIGFVGTVTPDLVSLESPANLAGIHVDDEADTISAINKDAAQLKAAGDQIVVLLTHEGAASTDCSTVTSAGGSFAQELNGVSDNVDAVLSGHTHLEYSCSMPKGATASNPLTTRPVMQAGSYGVALDQLVYSFDANGTPKAVTSNIVGVKGPVSTLFSAPDDAAVKSIVDDAVTASATAGAQVLGKLGGPFDRARLSDGTENRGGESTLGNQIAEIQRWATSGDDATGYVSSANGPAQIAFMNPGGLRADLEGTSSDGSGDLTYRAAADVQPFANELTNMSLTGDQIKTVLEEQWSRDNIDNSHANIPARPFLKLGISKGFTYTYHEVPDPVHSGAKLGVIDGMWLDGVPIDPDQTYSVTVNSFLATGGDNFWELAKGTHQEDTEQTDLQAQVDYMKGYGSTALPVDDSQRGVEVSFPADAPSTYQPGDTVAFDLASLDMTGKSAANTTGDTQDSSVDVKLGNTVLGTFPVSHGNSTQPYDDRGTASVSITLPADAMGDLVVVGNHTGTKVIVPLGLPKATSAVTADTQAVTAGSGSITATVSGSSTPTGSVTFKDGSRALGSASVGDDGVATLPLASVTLSAGTHTITATYSGDTTFGTSSTTFMLTVTAAPMPLQLGGLSAQSWTAETAISSVRASASGGTAPYVFSATGLPAGVSINPTTGVISGTPRAAGSGAATITATDSASHSVGTSLNWTVKAKPTGTPSGHPAPHPVAVKVKVVKKTIRAKHNKAQITITVTSANGAKHTGRITIRGSGIKGTGVLKNGKVTIKLKKVKPGKHKIRISFSGDATSSATTVTTTIRVKR